MMGTLQKVAKRSRRASRPALAGLGSLALLAAAAAPAVATSTPTRTASSPSSTVKFWGSFGTSSTISLPRTTPFPVYLPGDVKQIGTSNSTAYALLTDGTVYAWGLGADGQLGNGGTENSVRTAVKVDFPAGVRIASLPDDVMPYNEGLAIDTTGHIWGWGTNPFGDALCLGTQAPQLTPVRLPLRHVTDAAGAFGHAVYLSDGRPVACGSNFFGELGDGTRTATSTPVPVKLPPGADVARLTASWTNSGALLTDGTYYDWGYNAQGQLGQGVIGGFSTLPLRVKLPGRVREVFLGGSLPRNGQTLALLTNGDLFAWGDGRRYQLGTGTTATQPSPVLVRLPRGLRFTKIATSGATSYGITGRGDVYAWGYNLFGQVGNGSHQDAQAPVFVAGGARDISGTNFDVAISLRGGCGCDWTRPDQDAAINDDQAPDAVADSSTVQAAPAEQLMSEPEMTGMTADDGNSQ
jgi:alpha-tubulin suppressor-like RCC1 family protein